MNKATKIETGDFYQTKQSMCNAHVVHKECVRPRKSNCIWTFSILYFPHHANEYHFTVHRNLIFTLNETETFRSICWKRVEFKVNDMENWYHQIDLIFSFLLFCFLLSENDTHTGWTGQPAQTDQSSLTLIDRFDGKPPFGQPNYRQHQNSVGKDIIKLIPRPRVIFMLIYHGFYVWIYRKMCRLVFSKCNQNTFIKNNPSRVQKMQRNLCISYSVIYLYLFHWGISLVAE